MKETWLLKRRSQEKINELSNGLKTTELVARLLVNREILDLEQGYRFLYGDIKDLYDGSLMKDMEKAVDIIKEAVKQKKEIVIYGDYDCDGVISTTMLYYALKRCGASFKYYIPNREDEGYGMNSNRVKALKEEGAEIILTCDNGISAFEQVKLAKDIGMKVVLTDHHDIPFTENEEGEREYSFPEADAVINPKRGDCNYPFDKLCGAGVALKFISCLYKALGIHSSEADKLIEFCAIATVCDVVDLLDENRIIVKKGLQMLNSTTNKGLKALMKATGLEGKTISAYHLGFIIGPCINATGRLETADLSVELLITEDENRAEELAKTLFELNQRRQELTLESVENVVQQIEKNKMDKDKVLLIYNPHIHESIAGIVAGRIRERYNVPAIVMTQGKEMPKGSGRSIEEYNMFDELSKCKELLDKFGGHPMAAGLSVKEENLPKLRSMLLANCKLKEEDLSPKVKIDVKMPLNSISEKIVKDIESLEPFGKGNSSPLLGEIGVEVNRIWTMGKEKNILKFRCKIPGSYRSIDAISFDKYEDFTDQFIDKYGEEKLNEILNTSFCSFKMDFVFYPSINEYNGNRTIQIIIKNLRLS